MTLLNSIRFYHAHSEQAVIAHSSYQLGCLSIKKVNSKLIVTLLEVSEREEDVVGLYLSTRPLKIWAGVSTNMQTQHLLAISQ